MTHDVNTENTQAQMRKGILEFCILLIVSKKKAYVSDIRTTLQEADLLVVEGTLYPLLSRLKNAGLLTYDWQESKSGPPRKYYSLSPKGKATLKDLTGTWTHLRDSISSLLSTHA